MADQRKKPTKKTAKNGNRAPCAPKMTVPQLRELAVKLRNLAGSVESLAKDMEMQRVEFVKFDGSGKATQGAKLVSVFVNRAGLNLNERLDRV